MKAKDLASKLMENPEFDVEFTFVEYTERPDDKICMFRNIRKFKDIDIEDIGYSSKVIQLGGAEK